MSPGGIPGQSRQSRPVGRYVPVRGIYTESARLQRLDWLRSVTRLGLGSLQHTQLDASKLTGNIEGFVGAVEVPVGVAGPLRFCGENVQGEIYVPMATTEGALVSSATRGALAVTMAGGVSTRAVSQAMTRAPVFAFSRLSAAGRFASAVLQHLGDLRAAIRRVSDHAELISIEPVVLGRTVHLRFRYTTGDAAGQNMTTACTWHACQWILEQPHLIAGGELESFIIEGNTSGDKKASSQAMAEGRGIRVSADCLLPGGVVERVLKTTPDELVRGYQHIAAGAVHSGVLGSNANTANIVAAIFTATGQDIACVHESSVGQFILERTPDGVYASITLPGLAVGTVGGGTHLPTQHELLESMGCTGRGSAARLAEIIAGFALALDLSTVSAAVSGQFASAHERLGRNRPVRWLQPEELDAQFFESALGHSEMPGVKVTSVETTHIPMGPSVLSELTSRTVKKAVGLFPMQLRVEHDDVEQKLDVMVKVKPTDREVIKMAGLAAALCGGPVATHYRRFDQRLGFVGCDVRELALYEQTDTRFTSLVPKLYRTHRDDRREAYVIVMECLGDMELMDTSDHARGWSRRHLGIALRDLGQLHSIWYGKESVLRGMPWIGHVPNAADMVEMRELWLALADHSAQEFPEFVHGRHHDRLVSCIGTIDRWWPQIEEMPRTLVHNDFNPRNLAIRTDGRLCAYDWELATLHIPQHDLAELLCTALEPADINAAVVEELSEVHRRSLEAHAQTAIDRAQWESGYRLALRDLAVNRFGLYFVAHTVRHYGFLEQWWRNLWALIDLTEAADGS
ncbi:phosphotransferase [Streptomyces silvisoli]|uniref:hydroxymethylglutaryl-CoA reductase (NADPH) n=1 Tax=Streptomyces silvisoli TaxID=3034235 RepID=A0ABT5ZJQ9_9ACTN|nr:phosphotransferase [Streptomyces silvisoli]MDF3289896.1 phosphotransferase [Streptomyces silvisoli]